MSVTMMIISSGENEGRPRHPPGRHHGSPFVHRKEFGTWLIFGTLNRLVCLGKSFNYFLSKLLFVSVCLSYEFGIGFVNSIETQTTALHRFFLPQWPLG